jgi:hypothetical protein
MTTILWGFLFGTIGFGFFSYGRKQQRPVPLICGLVLMVFPYFITSTLWLVIVGGVLSVIPFVLTL